MNVRFSLPSGYAPLTGGDRAGSGNGWARPRALCSWAASLAEKAKYNDPSLSRDLFDFIEACKERKISLVRELTVQSSDGRCLVEAILESKNYQAMKLIFTDVPSGWLVPGKIEKTDELLLLWDLGIPGKARGLEWVGPSIYVGEFFCKQRSGQGRLYVGPMVYFEGEFQNNQRTGKFLCHDEARRPQKWCAMYIDDKYCGSLPGPATQAPANSFFSLLAGFFQNRR